MTEYRHGAHTVFRIHLHLVWTTKYRKPLMSGEVGLRLRELIREICSHLEATIIKGLSCGRRAGRKLKRQLSPHSGLSVRYTDATTFEVVEFSLVVFDGGTA